MRKEAARSAFCRWPCSDAVSYTHLDVYKRQSLLSSPEFTTNGMLRKCWRRIGGKVYLYKGGTEGAANTGNEPYSEFYAAQIAAAMGVHAIPYGLSRWKGVLCSTCELFTSKEYAYLPIGHLVSKGGMEAVKAYYEKLGTEFVNALNEMLVFDAVICNVDRHFGNFGVMVDNRTNTIVSPAPLFDHGNSLFNFAGADAWADEAALEAYIETLYPSEMCIRDSQIAVQCRLAGVIEVKDPHLVALTKNAHGLVLNVLQIQSYQLGDPESAVKEQGQDGVIALLIFTVHGAEQILALLQRQIAWQFLFQLGRVDIFDRIFTK